MAIPKSAEDVITAMEAQVEALSHLLEMTAKLMEEWRKHLRSLDPEGDKARDARGLKT